MKKCKKCGKIKPLTEFYKHPKTKDGFRGACKICINKQVKEWQENNYEKVKGYQKKHYQNNSKKEIENTKIWQENNFEKYKEYNKKWRKDNSEKIREYRKKEYIRLSKIPSYKINDAISNRIRQSLKGNKNGRHWETLVGYTKEELMEHLESQFEPWMTWENWGAYEKGKLKWHIDHIRPITSFNFTSVKNPEFRECWALENLRPLEAIKNMRKSNK